MQYKLAIIIPSWNCSRYIGEMLECIRANTFTDWKCFVVDDQSKDNSVEIIQTYCAKDERIVLKVRDRGPKGAQTCRNLGFELSKGAEYVIWFDADDLIAPYCFKQRVEYMDRHPELDFGVFPAKTFVNDIWDFDEGCYSYGIRFGEDALADMLKWCIPMVGWTNIYRRASVVHTNLQWDNKVLSMQDSDFNISAMARGLRYRFAWDEGANADYFYRKAENQAQSVSKKIFSEAHLNSHLYLLEKIFSSMNKEQQRKYKRNMECYAFRFAEIMCQSKSAYDRLLKNSWIKRNFRLRYALIMYRALVIHYPFNRFKGVFTKFAMLYDLPKVWNEKQREWYLFSNGNVKRMIDRHNIL